MLQAILATELERAIIDKLRNDDYCFFYRTVVCNTLELPYTPEALEYHLQAIDNSGEICGTSDAETERRKKKCKQEQKNRINMYHAKGYKDEPEFGKGAVAPFLKMV